jgi:Glycosyl transferase family 2
MPAAAWIAGGAAIVGGLFVVRWWIDRATVRILDRDSDLARAELEPFLDALERDSGPPPSSAPTRSDPAPIDPAWIDQVTLCIRTFQRPRCVARAIRTFKSRYPAMRVLVGDDGRRPLYPDGWTRGGVTWVTLPYDRGIGAGRNAVLARTTTPFLVNLDCDHSANETTDLGRLHEFLERSGFDLVGGTTGQWSVARFRREGDLLFVEVGHPPREIEAGVFETDRASTFFMARTDRVRALGWDEKRKLLEHTEFFYRTWRDGWRVAEIPEVMASHDREACMPTDRLELWLTYRRFRLRLAWFDRALRRLLGRPYHPGYDVDGLRQVKTIQVR